MLAVVYCHEKVVNRDGDGVLRRVVRREFELVVGKQMFRVDKLAETLENDLVHDLRHYWAQRDRPVVL